MNIKCHGSTLEQADRIWRFIMTTKKCTCTPYVMGIFARCPIHSITKFGEGK